MTIVPRPPQRLLDRDPVRRLSGLLVRQEVRYLIVGGWNTVFGYGIFVGLLYVLEARVHYMVIAVVCNVLAVTMAYATQKLFVFRTPGNLVREYFKFYGVQGVSNVVGLLALPFCVEVLRISPYVAPLLILVVTLVVSYLGHKHVSFR